MKRQRQPIIYSCVSETDARDGNQTLRMSTHRNMPDVHTWYRRTEDRRPYRMLYAWAWPDGTVEVTRASCLGVEGEYAFRDVDWLLEGEER